MTQSMHNGSMARAASALPISAVSQPNWSRRPQTICFAASSLPQMNIVGFPPLNCGLTIKALPTELKALMKRASANSRCERSMRDSSKLVKYFTTPFTGGASAIGFVASMMGLPARFTAPAARSASRATLPLTAKTTTSPNCAASEKAAGPGPTLLGQPARQLGRIARTHHDVMTVLYEARSQGLAHVS